MSPDFDPKKQMIRMRKGDRLEGQGGVINGPAGLKFQREHQSGKLYIYGEGKHLYIDGLGPDDIIKKIIEDSKANRSG